jgi:hypothetical protein
MRVVKSLKGTTVIVIARMCPVQHQGVHRDSTMEATAAMGAEARDTKQLKEEIEETRAPFWGACGWSNP